MFGGFLYNEISAACQHYIDRLEQIRIGYNDNSMDSDLSKDNDDGWHNGFQGYEKDYLIYFSPVEILAQKQS